MKSGSGSIPDGLLSTASLDYTYVKGVILLLDYSFTNIAFTILIIINKAQRLKANCLRANIPSKEFASRNVLTIL